MGIYAQLSGLNFTTCPWRIVDETGGVFATCLAGSSIFHALNGCRSATPGTSRLREMIKTIRLRAPIDGGRIAMWGFTYHSIVCMMVKLRKKDDSWNSIISAGAGSALLTVRHGPPVMAVSAVVGALMVGMIEGITKGVGSLIIRYYAYNNKRLRKELNEAKKKLKYLDDIKDMLQCLNELLTADASPSDGTRPVSNIDAKQRCKSEKGRHLSIKGADGSRVYFNVQPDRIRMLSFGASASELPKFGELTKEQFSDILAMLPPEVKEKFGESWKS